MQATNNNVQNTFLAGGASIRGWIHEDLDQPNQDTYWIDSKNSLFGVFDGHGDQGHVVSGTIKAKLSSQLASSLSLTNTVEEAIRHAFSAIDSHICSQNSSDSSGSTATVAYIDKGSLYLAAIGDCAAYLVQMNQTSHELNITPLFAQHKPNHPEESKRITASGGKIAGEYVVHPTNDDKMINITRAFGDQDLKAACGIISSPEIIVKKLDSDPNSESFLVLSSDGLDCVPSDKVMQLTYSMIHECMQSEEKNLDSMCDKILTQLEKSMFSADTNYFSDDTTVVVVLLSKW